MEIHARINFKEVESMFANAQKQLPYVLSQTINNTLLDAQQVQQERMLQTFIIRRPNFVKNSIKLSQFARKDTLTGILEVADVGAKPTADIWERFETGGTKTAKSGKLAIPTQLVTTSKTGVISKAKRPRNLRNSFKLKTKSGKEMIMQRKGRGKNVKVNVAYILAPSVQIDDRLMFIPTVEEVIAQNLGRHFSEAYTRAIITSK